AKLAYYRWSVSENRYLQLSDTFFEILGIPAELPLRPGDYMDPIVHPEDRERMIRRRSRAENQGRQIDLEYRILRPGGQACRLHEIAESKGGTKGATEVYFGSVQDITEQKRTEQELRESEERHRSVVAAMADGVLLLDRSGTIKAANGSAARILGLTNEEIMN